MTSGLPLVAIVGRPNVGKSTFFNRLTESRDAIVLGDPGITRDRVYGDANWNGVDFAVVDTGGFVPRASDLIDQAVREQVQVAVEEADAIVFVVDLTTGITDLDDEVADMLRRVGKPVLVLANKADNEKLRWEAGEFYALGLGEVFPVSAVNGSGTGELLDELVTHLPGRSELQDEPEAPRIAVVGRPNVGKSSVVNALLGVERSIVTEVSGTTRDAIDSKLRFHGKDVVLVDTAGLRRRSRIKANVEFYSVLRTERAIRSADVVVLVLDAVQGLESQDIRVLMEGERMKKGLVIAVNKWDLLEKETNTARDYAEAIRERLKTLNYVPVLFISALSGQRVPKVMERALQVDEERSRRITTSKLNEVLEAAVSATHPPTYRNRHVKIKYASQVRSRPPVIAVFCNHPEGVREPYRRYLENRFRAAFGFEGVPLTLAFKKK